MKLLILGANGQVGQSLCNLCIKSSIDFIVTTRAQLDITSQQNVIDYFANVDIDFVINATAYTNVEKAEDESELANAVNNLAIGYIAEECKAKNIPFIHISTDYVFDGTKQGMYSENDVTCPINVYGDTKLKGEQTLQQIWNKHIILRVSWVFSQFGNNFVKTMLKLSNSHEKLTIISDQYGSPTSANSIANIILDICNRIHNKPKFNNWGVYNYSDFPLTTWHQFANYVIDNNKSSVTKSIESILAKDFPTKAQRPQNSGLDTNKIKQAFDIKQQLWTTEVDRIIEILE